MDPLVYFYPTGHEAHFEPGHPERPERVEAIRSALVDQNWWEKYPKLDPLNVPDEILKSIHSAFFLDALQKICSRGLHFDADTYTTPASWDLALRAAGGALRIADEVWERRADKGFALTRPPGHHATRSRAMGFCLLNNIALAAEYLIKIKGAHRLAIIDLDLHHGNGTQEIFYERRDVFYISTHQSPLYPGSGWIDEVGSGEGKGFTANFPLPPFSGDGAFKAVIDHAVFPLLENFSPEMILVGYGFDPHWKDPLGSLLLTARGYGTLIRKLVDWSNVKCQGKLALILEGGYDLEAAQRCSISVVAALLYETIPDFPADDPGLYGYRESNAWKNVLHDALKLWNLSDKL